MEIRKLNALRGIAALIVIISHYSNLTNFLGGVLGNGAGAIGVMLFFTLSGFLMSFLYLNKKFNLHEVLNYAFARIARVIPLYILMVLSSYVLIKFGILNTLYDIPNEAILFSHLAFLSGTSVLWTIPAEIQFYFLFIFMWLLFSYKRNQLYILIIFTVVIITFFDSPRPKGIINGIPYDATVIRALPYFFAGIIFGQIYAYFGVINRYSSNFFVISLLIIPLLYPKLFIMITGDNHGIWKDVGVYIAVSVVFFIVTFLVPDDNFILVNRMGDFLGKISYSMYLLHLPILWQIQKQAIESPAFFFFLFIMITIVTSYLSHLVFEVPFGKLVRGTLNLFKQGLVNPSKNS